MLGLLLFKTFLADKFFIISYINIASYADNDILYITAKYIDALKTNSTVSFWWFDNILKGSPGKFHLLIGSNENVTTRVSKCDWKKVMWKN